MANSTRRLRARLASLSLGYLGCVCPYHLISIRLPETPLLVRYSLTAYALFFDNSILYSGVPVLSVWPSIRILVSGYFTKTFATFVRFTLASSLKMLELILKR